MNNEVMPRVLLADDESHIRMMMRTILVRAGFQVVAEARNGREAIELCAQHRPDVVLLDINMPLLNGDEALVRILEEVPGITAIMLTSVADSETVQQCLAAGAAHYLRKDTPVQEIARLVLETWKDWNASDEGDAS